jgi:uncharacterized protein YggE
MTVFPASPHCCFTCNDIGAERETIMAPSSLAAIFIAQSRRWRLLAGMAVLAAATATAQAQPQPSSPADARIIVSGEGSVSVPPDYAQIRSGVTTRAKTAKEAADANTKAMAGVTAVLLESGIARKDIQTSQFSIQPIYAPQEPRAEPKLSGYSVSNQVIVKVHQLSRLGELLDRLVTAGATDVGNIQFLVTDTSKALDQAREAALADARRKAELYARASGLALGRITWITEDQGYAPPMPMRAMQAPAARAGSVPIAIGEDTLQVRITVGFDIAR